MAGIPGSLTGTGTVGGTGMAAPDDYPGNGNNGIMSRSNMGMIQTRFPGESRIKSPQRLKRKHIRRKCVCLGEPGFRGTGRLLCPGIPCWAPAQRLRE